MKYLLLFLGILFFTSAEDTKLLKEFSVGYDFFAADIYREIIKSSPNNFIVCPLSIEVVLALIHSGSGGETSRQISEALQLPEKREDIEETFSDISSQLKKSNNTKHDLTIANKIYIADGFEISDSYRTIVNSTFNAEAESINFTNATEAADIINKWISDRTETKIQNVIDSSALTDDVMALIVNAIYFHGKWKKEFDRQYSKSNLFYVDANTSLPTDTMLLIDDCEYYESLELGAKFLKLDYEGGEVSMHIVLPDETEGLSNLEERISEVLIPPEYEMLSIYASLPKFSIESQINFEPILRSLGIEDLFGSNADLSGIGSKHQNLTVSQIVQKGFIEIDEEGTTSAAASVAFLDVRSSADTAFFIANHPFLFYLRLNKLGINFFVGRYTHP